MNPVTGTVNQDVSLNEASLRVTEFILLIEVMLTEMTICLKHIVAYLFTKVYLDSQITTIILWHRSICDAVANSDSPLCVCARACVRVCVRVRHRLYSELKNYILVKNH
jgi:hypothetical protein